MNIGGAWRSSYPAQAGQEEVRHLAGLVVFGSRFSLFPIFFQQCKECNSMVCGHKNHS
jgi:hypothetical protein